MNKDKLNIKRNSLEHMHSFIETKTGDETLFRCVCFIVCSVSMLMTIVNLLSGRYVLMAYTLAFGLLCAVDALVSKLGRIGEEASKIMFQIELFFLCLYFIISGNPDGFSIIWLLLIPGCSFLIFERWSQVVLCTSVFLLLIFFFYTPAGRLSLQYNYSRTFMLRFPMLYLAFSVVSLYISASFKEYQNKLLRVQARLKDEVELRTQELLTKERELEKLKMEAMISQIQPHFMYNTISAIAAIPGNSDQTVKALVDFGKYLRVNLDTFSVDKTIPVDSEIEHVRRYVSLEKLRFEDKIEVNFEIMDHDFLVPPLSIQMIVENAIKHGLQPQRRQGTVSVITERRDKEHVVTVRDSGAGFDLRKLDGDHGAHVGISNVEERIKRTCGGRLEIESEVGNGTVVRFYIPESRTGNEDNCSR